MAFNKTGKAPAKLVTFKSDGKQYIRGNVVDGQVELLDKDSLALVRMASLEEIEG